MNGTSGTSDPLRRQECFFWFCAVAALLVFLGRNSLFGVESINAEAARELRVNGVLWPPGINFESFPGLPLLSCWSIAACFFAGGVSEFAARLPVALAALALLVGVRSFSASLFDRRTALLAGWLTLGSYGFLYWGRSAAGYIPGCAAVVWAVAWYHRSCPRFGFWRALVFYLLVILGAALQSPCFLLLPGAFLLPGMWHNRRGTELFSLRSLAALIVVSAMAAAWFLFYRWAEAVQLWQAVVGLFQDGIRTLCFKSGGALLNSGGERSEPVYVGFYEVPRLMLPWTLVTAVAVVGMIRRFRSLPTESKSLLRGLLLLFLACSCPDSCRWPDFLPLLPFLAVTTAAGLLDPGNERWNRGAVFLTRSAIVLLAALGAVSPVALPVWRYLLRFELPMVVLAVWPIVGILVLLLMLLDSHPAQPLCRLTGLPPLLGSTILGGTMATICLISLVVPALRELRTEKTFLLELKSEVEDFAPESVVFIGDRDDAAVVLFYTRMRSPMSIVAENDEAGFAGIVSRHRGARIAIVTRYREGRELDFLRRCAAVTGLKLNIDMPDRMENAPPGYNADGRRLALWLVNVPISGALDSRNATGKGQ